MKLILLIDSLVTLKQKHFMDPEFLVYPKYLCLSTGLWQKNTINTFSRSIIIWNKKRSNILKIFMVTG